MSLDERLTSDASQAMHSLAAELFPLCRSITGNGVRESLRILQNWIPLEIHEAPTGEAAFDWTVPKEWNVRDAYIQDRQGRRIVDFRKSNLHVVHGSMPVRMVLSWEQLRPRLHTLPDQPDWIPYCTCHFRDDWGFCLSHADLTRLQALGNEVYEVCIDASLESGSLTYGELVLPGSSGQETLISAHICHPSLANDNLSGIVVAVFLARALQTLSRRHTWRFLFAPATLGAIVWLSRNRSLWPKIRNGLVLSGIGDRGAFTYRQSRRGDAEIDRAMAHVLAQKDCRHTIQPFEPFGYDQRQFCSPGINLPIGCLMRTPYGEYPQYHTSADNLDFICEESLQESLSVCLDAAQALESNACYMSRSPFGEPRLGPRGLYAAYGDPKHHVEFQRALLWTLNLSDGENDLIAVAERSKLSLKLVQKAAAALIEHQLLTEKTSES